MSQYRVEDLYGATGLQTWYFVQLFSVSSSILTAILILAVTKRHFRKCQNRDTYTYTLQVSIHPFYLKLFVESMIIHDFRTKLFLGTLNLQTYLYSALKDTLSVKEKAIMRYIIKLKEDIEKNTDTMKHHICVNENDQCVYLIGFL